MLKTITGMLPWVVVLAALGGSIWWLLSREMAAGKWLLAGLLVGHGAVHVMFAAPSPAATAGGPEWPFDMAGSWLVSGLGLDPNVVRAVGIALIAVVVAGFVLTGLATVGIVVPSGWWGALAVGSAAVSALTLGLFFNPQLILGLGIDAVLAWVVLAGAWSPAAA
jgi:hypothetical protein